MVRRLNLHVDYRLTSIAPAQLAGSAKVLLTLSGPAGWKRMFILAPKTRFVGARASTDVQLNLPQLQGVLTEIERLTGTPAFGAFSMAVGPQVQIAGTVAGRPVRSSFSPSLTFSFSSGQLQVAGGPGSSASASGGYTQRQLGHVSTPSSAPNAITTFGASLRIELLRCIALIGLLISLAATVYFYVRERGEPFEETFRIQAQYGHMIVPIVGGEDLGWPPVDVPNIKALVRLAEAGQRLILHNRADNVDTYMVNEEGTVYRYQVKPSKVVWGDWSASPAALEEAA